MLFLSPSVSDKVLWGAPDTGSPRHDNDLLTSDLKATRDKASATRWWSWNDPYRQTIWVGKCQWMVLWTTPLRGTLDKTASVSNWRMWSAITESATKLERSWKGAFSVATKAMGSGTLGDQLREKELLLQILAHNWGNDTSTVICNQIWMLTIVPSMSIYEKYARVNLQFYV